MKKFLQRRIVYISIALIAIIGIIILNTGDNTPTWTSDVVTQGTVRTITSVSGTLDAVGTAELAFPVSGTIESIPVKEGDVVTKGQILATLVRSDLNADYRDAQAALLIAQADRDELVSGLRPEERDVTKTTEEIAEANLDRITAEQTERLKNAYRILLSTDLEAKPDDLDDGAFPPIITGTYTCDEGIYTLDLYNSGARSGYSFRLSGLEGGTFTAYTDTSGPLGTCGLSIQFIDGESYGNSTWTITIPNTESASYVTNLNAYNLALTQGTNAIREAEQDLILAQQNTALDIADPRTEARTRAEAKVLQAEARVAVVSAQIQDSILTAPFDGMVTHIEPVVGEAVGTSPSVTMVSDEAFALTARIPEIDITKLHIGQKAEVVFDARQNETLPASVIFISPLAEEIDGVSYFEAKLILDGEIDWLRSGLNADVDIIIDTHENVTRIPKRYLIENDGSYTVSIPNGNERQSVPVTVTFMGNDGFVEISGLEVGATVIAP